MSAVEENARGIARPELRPFREIRRGYTWFAEGDVLFAKITPCMQNGKHAVARGLIDGIGFGTTEFHVIRPALAIMSEWVLRFLMQPSVLREAAKFFTGAVGQQRVPDEFLNNLTLPLPPAIEQRRILGALNEQLDMAERAGWDRRPVLRRRRRCRQPICGRCLKVCLPGSGRRFL